MVSFDSSELDNGDIAMVMQQAGVKRPAAVAALRSNSGDVVNAIMELSE